MDARNEPKQFAWSYSRLKAFEDCPRRYHETQVKKDAWPEAKSEILEYGDAVHSAMAQPAHRRKVANQIRIYLTGSTRSHAPKASC
jgi:hypothetical protein